MLKTVLFSYLSKSMALSLNLLSRETLREEEGVELITLSSEMQYEDAISLIHSHILDLDV